MEGTRMNKREQLVDLYDDSELLFADGFDDAIVGVTHVTGRDMVVCYDYDECIEILGKEMTYDESIEYFEYNVQGAHMGDRTPLFIRKFDFNQKCSIFKE